MTHRSVSVAIALCFLSCAYAAEAPKELPPFARTDYGTTYSAMIKAPRGNNTPKAICIRVGDKDHPANIVFDTEMLRWATAWTGGWLKLPEGRDGIEGLPVIQGEEQFATRVNIPGWAKDGSFKDPRPTPHGPLPRDHARYTGLYTHGSRVVLSYTMGTGQVQELPGYHAASNAFVRNIALSATPGTSLLILDKDGTGKAGADSKIAQVEKGGVITTVALIGGPEGAKLSIARTQVQLDLPAIAGRSVLQLRIWTGPSDKYAAFVDSLNSAAPEDPAPFTKPAEPRWKEVITTKGEVGKGKGAYVVDTLTVPYENPYQSYMRTSCLDFLPDGRCLVGTMDGDIYLVSGIDDKLENLTWRRFASGMHQPLGMKVLDGKIYVLCRDQITRLHDLNNDGEADFYECFNNDVQLTLYYHEFGLDLHADSKGNFYFMKGSDLGTGGTIHSGCMLRVSKDGSKLDVYAMGFRAANGMGVGPNDEITAGDNQGEWTPLCPINWVEQGKYYGFPLRHHEIAKKENNNPREKPLVWIPMWNDNSNGSQVWVTSDKWGPLTGRMLHLSYGRGTLLLVMVQDVAGQKQGAVTRFPFKFLSGAMRGRFNPVDGQLYVCGIRGWQTDGVKEGCLQRVRYTGKPFDQAVEWKASKGAMEIGFLVELDAESVEDPDAWSVEAYNVVRTRSYGSPEFKISDPQQQGRDAWEIKSVKLLDGGKRVRLEVPDLTPCTNVIIKYKIRTAAGATLNQEVDATVNGLP